MDDYVIQAKSLEKIYRIYHKTADRYKDFFLPKKYGDTFYALDGISFDLKKWQSLRDPDRLYSFVAERIKGNGIYYGPPVWYRQP